MIASRVGVMVKLKKSGREAGVTRESTNMREAVLEGTSRWRGIFARLGRYLMMALMVSVVVGAAQAGRAGHAVPLRASALVRQVAVSGQAPVTLDPLVLSFKLPEQIQWTDDPAAGSMRATLAGDPSKPGIYVVLVRWKAHHMSRPHFHPNDRFITVISGTWWVGTGAKFDPESTVAMPAGSFVTHFGKHVHFDGAKDEDAVLEIVGEGPATPTPVEVK